MNQRPYMQRLAGHPGLVLAVLLSMLFALDAMGDGSWRVKVPAIAFVWGVVLLSNGREQ